MKGKVLAIIAIALLLVGGAFFLSNKSTKPGQYDAFAKCLSEKGVKMYGAFWCTHCKNQKKEFGTSFQYVNYIECSTPNGNGQLAVCKDANITGYPTWEFADGERLEGVVPLDKLAEKSQCQI